MSLDTQKFGISRHWLSVALEKLPAHPDLFAKKNLSAARKAFLAGSRQLPSIKNWLSGGGIIMTTGKGVELTDLGRLIAAQDAGAQHAWTWWLFHLHLCANVDSFPYCTFFTLYDADSRNWLTFKNVVGDITDKLNENVASVTESTMSSYFEGVEMTLRPGNPIHDLGLVERRSVAGEGGQRIRRQVLNPPDLVTTYAALLFYNSFFAPQPSVETRMLLNKGLGKVIGFQSASLRDALMRVHQNPNLGKYLQYSRVANLDSVSFPERSPAALRAHGYSSGDIQWP